MKENIHRKQYRLKCFDYSSVGAYFITICTKDRQNLFWTNTAVCEPNDIVLSDYGKIVDEAIQNISKHYPNVTVDHYVIMPNHVHLLLQLHTIGDEYTIIPKIPTIIQQMKGYITKQTGKSIWQKLYYDHIVRGKDDYWEIYRYIENNPMKWYEDCYNENLL